MQDNAKTMGLDSLPKHKKLLLLQSFYFARGKRIQLLNCNISQGNITTAGTVIGTECQPMSCK
jgi:hypothetical protein